MVLEDKCINNHEITGIFDYTRKNIYGYYEPYNLILEHEYEIKKCFIEQCKKAKTDTEILQCSLLLPYKYTYNKLKIYLERNGLEIKDFFEAIKYNFYIFDIITRDEINKDKNVKFSSIPLTKLIQFIYDYNLQKRDDILIIENSCKSFYNEPLLNKKRKYDLMYSNLNTKFDYKSALKAKRTITRSK